MAECGSFDGIRPIASPPFLKMNKWREVCLRHILLPCIAARGRGLGICHSSINATNTNLLDAGVYDHENCLSFA